MLQPADAAGFRARALAGLPPKPSYYARLKELNTSAPPQAPPAADVRALPPAAFRQAIDAGGAVLLDTRHMLAFGGGHLPAAWNIGAAGHLAIWAGWMLDPARPLLLVLDDDAQLGDVVAQLARTGFDRFAGYLAGGITAWQNAGLPLQPLRQLHAAVAATRAERGELELLDVRSPQEWRKGHAPRARHVFLPELPRRLEELPTQRPLAVYCDSGYRAAIAASLLQARGYDVANVPGSWQAWTACGLPVETG